MAYHNIWNSTDQVADRTIAGEPDPVGAPASAIRRSRWGELDNSDGGKTGRYSLSADWHRRPRQQPTACHSVCPLLRLDLFSNFTYFLDDPIRGDQFEQQDARYIFGGAIDRAGSPLFGAEMKTTVGVQFRDDEIRNGLFHTERRQRLSSDVFDHISQSSGGLYIRNEAHWTPWLVRSWLRGDLFIFDVTDISGAAIPPMSPPARPSPRRASCWVRGRTRNLSEWRFRLSQQ